MKRTTFLFGLLLIFSSAFSQSCTFSDDYSNAGLWTYYYHYYAVSGACLSDLQHGSLSITAGKFNFNNINDANDTRYFRSLGTTLNDATWTASFQFEAGSAGTDGKTGHMIFSLSNGTENPFSDSYSICEWLDQDALAVAWFAEYNVDPDNVGFEIWANDDGAVTMSERIAVDYDVTYYLRLTRFAGKYMSLQVFVDPGFTILFGEIPCFEVPESIIGLNTLQHGNLPGGSYQRKLSGSLDNTCITDLAGSEISGPDSLCSSVAADFSIEPIPGSMLQWNLPPGIIFTGEITDPQIHVTEWPDGPGTYIISCIYQYQCYSDTLYKTVEIIDVGIPAILDTGFCAGGSVEIDVLHTDDNYLWYDGSTASTHDFNSEGIYWVQLEKDGCLISDTVVINEFPAATIDLGNDILFCGTIYFNAPGGFTDYQWSNGSTSTLIETNTSGIYSLTVTNDYGCKATDEIEFINNCGDVIAMPSAFSPNSDGVNDLLGPDYIGAITDYHLQIWNRWGELIFETNKVESMWDGTYKNTDQEIGSYVYYLSAMLNRDPVSLTGNITLVR